LAAIFWGEYSTRTSRKYLRNALWRVRHLLQSVGALADEYLIINDDSVSFSHSGPYSLDVEDFETVTARYQETTGRELTVAEAAQLEEAIALYSGDLLAGIYEDWCLYERERLNLLYLNTLGKLMIFHEFNGTYDQGLAHGRRILACDNTRERVHRRLMRLYWQLGNRGAALAQYKLCEQVLREALDVSPLEETTRLYQQMKYGQFKPGIWASYQMARPPVRARTDESVPLLAEQALQRLRHLQTTIEQASAELRQIERQLVKVLAGSWDVHTSDSPQDLDD
jgi:DNA-binding SARP family transcriptional activator